MDKQQLSNLLHIQKASCENRLVVFVGAGVSANSGIPTWSELINSMKQELPVGVSHETDPLKIAQLYKDSRGHKEYMDKIIDALSYDKAVPNEIHKSILALNPSHIITTNWDDLIEQEIASEFLQYDVIREDKDIPQIASPNVLVKMHGDFSKGNIVFTENDYFNYGVNFPLTRAYVQSLFASKLVLFVGFSFADLNLKLILNELQNILSDNMQRAYLLSCEEPDYITRQYFEKKGINIIYFSENDIDILNQKTITSNSLVGLGQHTNKILFAIKHYSRTSREDLAQYLYNRILPYYNELRSLGDGFKYFFPNYKDIHWNAHSEGLQTGLAYFQDLEKSLKTNSAKREFLREHPDIKLNTLLSFAFYNYLFEIDGLRILDDNFMQNIEKYIKLPVLYHIHRFDTINVCKELKQLRTRTINYTIEDLELPYTLYVLGDYREAYQEYSKLIPLYWNKKKHILYFICRYNLWSIRHSVHFQLILDDEHDVSKEIELATNTDLDVILNKLPIATEIKKIFSDLISFRAIGGHAINTEELNEQIFEQRKSAEKGGVSINSNISRLMATYERESLFSWANYIVCDNNSYFKAICENHAMGILNSISTPAKSIKGSHFESTRILSLTDFMLESLFFDIENKRLKDIIKHYEIGLLKLHTSGIEYINTCLCGLLSKEPAFFKEIRLLYNPLNNLLLLVSKTKEKEINAENLYNVIVKYQTKNFSAHFPHEVLEAIVKNYPPNEKTAKNLIIKLLDCSVNRQEYANCIYLLVNLLQDKGCTFNEFDFAGLNDKESIATEISFLYPIVTNELKETIKAFSLKEIKSFHDYIFFVNHNGISEHSAERFKDLLDKESISELTSRECFIMAEIRHNPLFATSHSIIDSVAEKSDCLCFYLSPFEYTQPNKVEIEWIFKFNDDIKTKLFGIDSYRKKLMNFLVEENLSRDDRDYLMNFI